MRVYLVRHGQTEWNSTGRAQGHTDIPLDDDGRAQVDMLERRFAHLKIDVLSSDLKRAADTARAICARPVLDPRLRERGFGEWEGIDFHDIHKRASASGLSLFEFTPPGGESFHDVWDRVKPVARELFERKEDLVVVSHGGTCAILLAQLLQGSYDTSRSFRFGNTAMTTLERRPEGQFLMTQYNDMSHLAVPARQGDLGGST